VLVLLCWYLDESFMLKFQSWLLSLLIPRFQKQMSAGNRRIKSYSIRRGIPYLNTLTNNQCHSFDDKFSDIKDLFTDVIKF
jgi:hypothetical protein